MFARLLLALLLSCCASTAAAQASRETSPRAPEPEHLTSRRRVMVSGAIGGYWSSDRATGYGAYADWAVYAHPSLVYFVRDRVGVGLGVSGGTSKSRSPLFVVRDRDVGFGPIALFDLPLSERLSVFFTARAGYFEQWLDRTPTDLGRTLPGGQAGFGLPQGALFQQQLIEDILGLGPDRRRFLRFSLSIPLVVHLSDAVGLGLGPDLWCDVLLGTDRYTRTQLGASSTIYVSF